MGLKDMVKVAEAEKDAASKARQAEAAKREKAYQRKFSAQLRKDLEELKRIFGQEVELLSSTRPDASPYPGVKPHPLVGQPIPLTICFAVDGFGFCMQRQKPPSSYYLGKMVICVPDCEPEIVPDYGTTYDLNYGSHELFTLLVGPDKPTSLPWALDGFKVIDLSKLGKTLADIKAKSIARNGASNSPIGKPHTLDKMREGRY